MELSRAYGIVNMAIIHRLSYLGAVGELLLFDTNSRMV